MRQLWFNLEIITILKLLNFTKTNLTPLRLSH